MFGLTLFHSTSPASLFISLPSSFFHIFPIEHASFGERNGSVCVALAVVEARGVYFESLFTHNFPLFLQTFNLILSGFSLLYFKKHKK